MSDKAVLSGLEALFKAEKWKKSYGFFYKDLNDDILAHFQPFFKGQILRVQYGITSRTLNRVAWDLRGISMQFGTPKQQLANCSKCTLYFAIDATEIEEPKADVETANMIGDACIRNAQKFSSIETINTFLEDMPPENQRHWADDRLCVALARGDIAAARAIVATAEREHIAFELSIFAKAQQALGR